LTIAGVPVGKSLQPPTVLADTPKDKGSVMIVLASDAPLDSRQLHRLCVRAAAGLARTGSMYGHGSGDFVIAFSTAQTLGHDAPPLVVQRNYLPDEAAMDVLFRAVAETVAEAVYNALCAARTVTGRDGHVGHALPMADAAALVQKFYAGGLH
jgi:D-aminopeptidase